MQAAPAANSAAPAIMPAKASAQGGQPVPWRSRPWSASIRSMGASFSRHFASVTKRSCRGVMPHRSRNPAGPAWQAKAALAGVRTTAQPWPAQVAEAGRGCHRPSPIVMAGLDPATHAEAARDVSRRGGSFPPAVPGCAPPAWVAGSTLRSLSTREACARTLWLLRPAMTVGTGGNRPCGAAEGEQGGDARVMPHQRPFPPTLPASPSCPDLIRAPTRQQRVTSVGADARFRRQVPVAFLRRGWPGQARP